jgi:hypothetical protein
VRVEARRDDNKVGAKLSAYLFERRVEHSSLLYARSLRAHGYVQSIVAPAPDSRLAARSRARIPGILVHGEEEDGRVVVKDSLRAVAMMNVPIDDGDALYLTVASLRVARGDGDVIEETEAHSALTRSVVSGRTHWDEGVLGLAAHKSVNGATRRARAPERRVHRAHGDDRIRVQVCNAFAHGALDRPVVLRRMARLHIAARRGHGFDLRKPRPQRPIAAQGIHHDRVARRLLRMMLARVVLFEDLMMNDRGRHRADYARARIARSNLRRAGSLQRLQICLITSRCEDAAALASASNAYAGRSQSFRHNQARTAHFQGKRQ